MLKQRAFVTGGGGFVGYEIVSQLVASNEYSVVRVLSHNHKFVKDIQKLRGSFDCVVDVRVGNLEDSDFILECASGIDTIFHCAAFICVLSSTKFQRQLHNSIVVGTRNIIEACKQQKVKKLIYIGSIEALGVIEKGELLTEGTGFRPEAAVLKYGYYKALASLEVENELKSNNGVSGSIIVPCSILGPSTLRKPYRTINVFINYYLQGLLPFFVDGSFVFTDVRDVARVAIRAEKVDKYGGVYIVGNEKLDMEIFFKKLSAVSGRRMPIKLPTVFAKCFVFLLETFYHNAFGINSTTLSIDSMKMLDCDIRISSRTNNNLGIKFKNIEESFEDMVDLRNQNGNKDSPILILFNYMYKQMTAVAHLFLSLLNFIPRKLELWVDKYMH